MLSCYPAADLARSYTSGQQIQMLLQARIAVVEWLKEKGLYVREDPHGMRLGISQRSRDVIEPVLKPQWYVKMKDMAAEAVAATRDKRLTIKPSEYEVEWFK